MALSFPASPSIGTTYTSGSRSWRWDGSRWQVDLGARTPSAHASTHATGGSDPITPASIGAATSSQGAKADSASQPGHTHPLSDITQSGATSGQVPTWNGTAWAPATPTSGGGTPAAHASTHATGGSDPITPISIGAIASNITGMTGATQLTNIVQITQAGYNALTPNQNTVYIIVN